MRSHSSCYSLLCIMWSVNSKNAFYWIAPNTTLCECFLQHIGFLLLESNMLLFSICSLCLCSFKDDGNARTVLCCWLWNLSWPTCLSLVRLDFWLSLKLRLPDAQGCKTSRVLQTDAKTLKVMKQLTCKMMETNLLSNLLLYVICKPLI